MSFAREQYAQPLVIDTDPGLDDLIAIVAASSILPIAGLTTVAGNGPIGVVTANAVAIRNMLREGLPVGRGAAAPLTLGSVFAPHIHGPDGLRGLALRRATPTGLPSASDVLLHSPVTDLRIAALGPLTNVAIALQEENARNRITEITWLGGAYGRGNITPVAEFNAYVDPHAANIVLGSGVPLRIVPLNVSRQLAARDILLPSSESEVARLTSTAFRLLRQSSERVHDLCAIAAVAQPDLFMWEPRRLRFNEDDGPERGRLIESGTMALVATSLDPGAVAALASMALTKAAC